MMLKLKVDKKFITDSMGKEKCELVNRFAVINLKPAWNLSTNTKEV